MRNVERTRLRNRNGYNGVAEEENGGERLDESAGENNEAGVKLKGKDKK